VGEPQAVRKKRRRAVRIERRRMEIGSDFCRRFDDILNRDRKLSRRGNDCTR
jgi:hypothetical protein